MIARQMPANNHSNEVSSCRSCRYHHCRTDGSIFLDSLHLRTLPRIGSVDRRAVSLGHNRAVRDSECRNLDGDGSRNFFDPSRRLNRWGVRSAPGRVCRRTGVWPLAPASGGCRVASLAGRISVSLLGHDLGALSHTSGKEEFTLIRLCISSIRSCVIVSKYLSLLSSSRQPRMLHFGIVPGRR